MKEYDLQKRTLDFSCRVIELATRIPRNAVSMVLISQLVRAGTSVGANYEEADCAESRRDFEHKIGICKKEAGETKYWLELVKKLIGTEYSDIEPLWQEASELQKIFIAIVKKSRENRGN